MVHRTGRGRPVPGRVPGRRGAVGTAARAARECGPPAAGRRAAGGRHDPRPDREGAPRHGASAAAALQPGRHRKRRAGGAGRRMARRCLRHAVPGHRAPAAAGRPRRARRGIGGNARHPVGKAGGGVGVGTAAGRWLVPEPDRSGREQAGRRRRGGRDSAHVRKLAHADGRSAALGTVLRGSRRRERPVGRTRKLSCHGVRSRAAQPPPGGRRRGESGAGASHQPPHRRRRRPAPPVRPVRSVACGRRWRRQLVAARSPRDHRSSRGDRLPVACEAGHVRIRRRPR